MLDQLVSYTPIDCSQLTSVQLADHRRPVFIPDVILNASQQGVHAKLKDKH